MDWMQFVAAIVGSLAWPSAAVIMVLTLRTPLAKLLPLIQSLRYKDLQVTLGQQLEEVKEAVAQDANADIAQPQIAHPPPASPSVLSLARIDPRAAILTSWVDVEAALRGLAAKANIEFTSTPLSALSELYALDAIDELTFNTIRDLRRVRNEAAHLHDRRITFDEAFEMEQLCQWAAFRLRAYEQAFPVDQLGVDTH